MNAPKSPLTLAEQERRNDLAQRKPHVAAKLARIAEMEERGEISPIIRLEKSYLCNFRCSHCSAEYYMDRHLGKVLKVVDARHKMDPADIRRLSREADELGLARFAITGGEPLVMKDFDAVVAAIDPDRHYVVTDTNGWFLDHARARHLQAIGVDKVQLSLDHIIEAEHDRFRNKPGSWKRVMRAIDASLEAGLNLLLATVLVRNAASTPEFRALCRFATERGVALYVSYAKPTGACSAHPELVISKKDADTLRELEKEYRVFTHMTPSYGSFKGCITMKGILTVTSTLEVTPCPYIDMSLGNLAETPLKEILARGMKNPWVGPHRPDCIIGEDPDFIQLHADKTRNVKFLPLPWGKGFSEHDVLLSAADAPAPDEAALFDAHGRCLPHPEETMAHHASRRRFVCPQPALAYPEIFGRIQSRLGGSLSEQEFIGRVEAITKRLSARPEVANLLRGAHVPFFLPRSEPACGMDDLGSALEERYLPAVADAFVECFPAYRFTRHDKSSLAEKLTAAPEGRHQRLLDAMQEDDVVGLYFPCLTEYALPAARRRVVQLPPEFLLAGGFDTCAALMGSPDLLFDPQAYPPLLWLSGLEAEKAHIGYHFEAYGYNLTFNRRAHLGENSEYWAHALVVLG
ncbi:MAG: radical SAM protein [Zoogloeaceae bacterium]|jgi:MoaA/NifB/PqqE/SkfB family radical SAM enzyme|nr:radical SAM protein [Zoogloeaceae bacterium]